MSDWLDSTHGQGFKSYYNASDFFTPRTEYEIGSHKVMENIGAIFKELRFHRFQDSKRYIEEKLSNIKNTLIEYSQPIYLSLAQEDNWYANQSAKSLEQISHGLINDATISKQNLLNDRTIPNNRKNIFSELYNMATTIGEKHLMCTRNGEIICNIFDRFNNEFQERFEALEDAIHEKTFDVKPDPIFDVIDKKCSSSFDTSDFCKCIDDIISEFDYSFTDRVMIKKGFNCKESD